MHDNPVLRSGRNIEVPGVSLINDKIRNSRNNSAGCRQHRHSKRNRVVKKQEAEKQENTGEMVDSQSSEKENQGKKVRKMYCPVVQK